MLRWADPLPTDLDDLAVAQVIVERTTTNALVCLENDDRATCVVERVGGGKSGEPRSNQRNVCREFLHALHHRFPSHLVSNVNESLSTRRTE